jgi:hypothetical protein
MIVILALGSSLYGRLAFNCALSIKANWPTARIHLFYATSALRDLTPAHLQYFDHQTELDPSYYVYGKRVMYFRAKSHLADFSPYERTLFLDADTLILPNRRLEELWHSLSETDYAAQTYNAIQLSNGQPMTETGFPSQVWATIAEMMAYYDLPETAIMPQINSSFLYFQRSERVLAFFELVKTLYQDPHPPCRTFRKEFPDEFFFHVAGAMTGLQAPQIPFTPLWGAIEFEYPGHQALLHNYCGLMTYGEFQPQHVQALYDQLLDRYHHQMGFTHEPFYHIDKKDCGIWS